MMMRGVEKQHSGAVTSAMLGAFRDARDAGGVPVAGGYTGCDGSGTLPMEGSGCGSGCVTDDFQFGGSIHPGKELIDSQHGLLDDRPPNRRPRIQGDAMAQR